MKILFCTLLCLFSCATVVAQEQVGPIAPGGLTVGKEQSLAETARIAYQNEHLQEHFATIFDTEEQFVRAMCTISNMEATACNTAKGERWTATFPEDIRRIVQNLMTKNYEIMRLAERASLAESTAVDTTERLEDATFQNESLQREAEALQDAYASMTALHEMTSSSLQSEEERRSQAEASLALERRQAEASLLQQREEYVRYGLAGTAIALTLLLIVLMSSRKKDETQVTSEEKVEIISVPSDGVAHIRLQTEDELPDGLRGKCKSVASRYGQSHMFLARAKQRKNRGVEVIIPKGNGYLVVAVNSKMLWKHLSDPGVETTIRKNWSYHFPVKGGNYKVA